MDDRQKVLTLMVDHFRRRHGFAPHKIVVAPVALLALGLKQSAAPVWDGVPLECRLFAEAEVASNFKRPQAKYLGIFARESRGQLRLAACDLL